MSNVKPLEKLTEKEFNILKKQGLLKSIYPDAPDSYDALRPYKKPEQLKNPDFSGLILVCESHLQQIDEEEREDNDSEHYIYEAAMEAIYGSDVWKFINKKIK